MGEDECRDGGGGGEATTEQQGTATDRVSEDKDDILFHLEAAVFLQFFIRNPDKDLIFLSHICANYRIKGKPSFSHCFA